VRKVGNQNGEIVDCSYEDVETFLYEMFDDDDQFIVWSIPDMSCGVRYVQACLHDNRVAV